MTEFMMSQSDAIDADISFIKEILPEAAILTQNRETICFRVVRTAYSSLQVRVQFTEEYPKKVPIVEITNKSLPPPLLRNKERECEAAAKKQLGRPQLEAIFTLIYDFVQDNLFIPCWKEVKKVAAMCEGKSHKLGCDDKRGLLQLRLRNGEYKQSVDIRVPEAYPEEGVEIRFVAGNLPWGIANVYKSHSEEVVRRCVHGLTAEQALDAIRDIDAGRNQRSKLEVAQAAKERVVLNKESLKSLQHDVKVLKRFADLREANVAKEKNHQGTLHTTEERREFRKSLRRLAKTEHASDAADEERRLCKAEQQEALRLEGARPKSSAQPSLLASITYLLQHYMGTLPHEICQSCKQCCFPTDPHSPIMSDAESDQHPLRVVCGHWLHRKCLDTWLTTPPFIHQCPVCDRRIWHPDWPDDPKKLEKAYNAQQAKIREMNDVADFLDMGADFRVT